MRQAAFEAWRWQGLAPAYSGPLVDGAQQAAAGVAETSSAVFDMIHGGRGREPRHGALRLCPSHREPGVQPLWRRVPPDHRRSARRGQEQGRDGGRPRAGVPLRLRDPHQRGIRTVHRQDAHPDLADDRRPPAHCVRCAAGRGGAPRLRLPGLPGALVPRRLRLHLLQAGRGQGRQGHLPGRAGHDGALPGRRREPRLPTSAGTPSPASLPPRWARNGRCWPGRCSSSCRSCWWRA